VCEKKKWDRPHVRGGGKKGGRLRGLKKKSGKRPFKGKTEAWSQKSIDTGPNHGSEKKKTKRTKARKATQISGGFCARIQEINTSFGVEQPQKSKRGRTG